MMDIVPVYLMVNHSNSSSEPGSGESDANGPMIMYVIELFIVLIPKNNFDKKQICVN